MTLRFCYYQQIFVRIRNRKRYVMLRNNFDILYNEHLIAANNDI